MNSLMKKTILSIVFAVAIATIIASGGDSNTFNAETTRIDCEIGKISVVSTVVGTNSVSGDTLSGTITIKCDQDLVDGVTITSSASWLASVGPSVAGVITIAQAASWDNDDIGTKTVKLTVKGKDASGNDAEKIINISVVIS